MGKYVISGDMLILIAELRETTERRYSYVDIAKILSEKYSVAISSEGVRKAYLKYRGK